MPDQSSSSLPFDGARAAAAVAATTAQWLSPDDDLALGCECADPVLQIERWAQEAPVPPVRG